MTSMCEWFVQVGQQVPIPKKNVSGPKAYFTGPPHQSFRSCALTHPRVALYATHARVKNL